MIRSIKKVFPYAAVLLPGLALAAVTGGLQDSIDTVKDLVNQLIPIVVGIGLLVFLWGLVKYLISAGEEDKKGAVKLIVTGVVILFVMVGVWGLVSILASTVGIDAGGHDDVHAPDLPS